MSIHPYALNREMVDERLRRALPAAERRSTERMARRDPFWIEETSTSRLEKALSLVAALFRVGAEPELPSP